MAYQLLYKEYPVTGNKILLCSAAVPLQRNTADYSQL